MIENEAERSAVIKTGLRQISTAGLKRIIKEPEENFRMHGDFIFKTSDTIQS